jgi:hypothetical protein
MALNIDIFPKKDQRSPIQKIGYNYILLFSNPLRKSGNNPRTMGKRGETMRRVGECLE